MSLERRWGAACSQLARGLKGAAQLGPGRAQPQAQTDRAWRHAGVNSSRDARRWRDEDSRRRSGRPRARMGKPARRVAGRPTAPGPALVGTCGVVRKPSTRDVRNDIARGTELWRGAEAPWPHWCIGGSSHKTHG
jgi:hypothetical protein